METQNLFNIEDFNIKLDTDYIGRNFVYIDEIDSTNEFFKRDKEFQEHGTVLLSEFQTHGKGRDKKEWISAKGQNLLFSILLTKGIKLKNINLYNLAAAVAIGDALENLFQLKPEMKWPNDVLINKKKISGILCESVIQGETTKKLIIGIGINVNQVNFQGKYNILPTSIRKETSKKVKRERLLSEFLNILESTIEEMKTNPEKVLDSWRDKSKLLGEKVWIRTNEKEYFGLFKDVDSQGFMILQTQEGIKTIRNGDLLIKK